MDIGSTAERLTRLSDSLWKWRTYVPLIAMTGLCAHLMLENRSLNLQQVQMLERIIREKEVRADLIEQNTRLDKAVRDAEIEKLQTLLNNSRR